MTGKTVETKNNSHAMTMAVILITSFLTAYTSTSVNLAIPSMSVTFGAPASQMNWIVMAYVLMIASVSIPIGRIADFVGRKRLVSIGLVIFSLATLITSFAANVELAILMRLIQGIGGAMVMIGNTAILIATFPKEIRGRILGLNVTFVYIGQSTGPVVGGFFTHNFGWQSVFVSMSIIGAIACVLSIFRLKELDIKKEEYTKGALDTPGIAMYVSGILLTMYGLSEVMSNRLNGILIVIGITLILLFVRHEKKTEKPIIDINLFKNPNFVLPNLATVFNFGAVFATGYFLSIYLQLVKGFDAQSAGFVMITQPVLIAAFSFWFGRLSDKYSPSIIASIGIGITAFGLFLFTRMTVDSPISFVLVGLIVVGIGFGVFSPSNTNAIMSAISPEQLNSASAMLPTTRHIGNISCMAVIAFLTNYKLGTASFNVVTTDVLMNVIHLAFSFFCVICAIGVVISLQRKKSIYRTLE